MVNRTTLVARPPLDRRHADRILVLAGGRVVESDPRSSSARSRYRRLYASSMPAPA